MTKNALIIEDNEANAKVLAMLLANEGLNSTLVSMPYHLPIALNQLKAVDIIFLDLELPDVDGFELIIPLKYNVLFQEIPIVAYTAHTGEMERARRLGFHSFLGKPLSAKHFPGQLDRILNGDRVWEI